MDDTVLNRRKFTRQPIQLSALVHPELGRSWLCSIRDFCEEGMLLTGGGGSRSLTSTGSDIGPGEQVALHFSVATPTGHEHFRTQAQVARVLDGGNGLGVFFNDGLDKRAFKNLAEFAVATGTAVPELSEQDEVSEAASTTGGSGLAGRFKPVESAEAALGAGHAELVQHPHEELASIVNCFLRSVSHVNSSRHTAGAPPQHRNKTHPRA